MRRWDTEVPAAVFILSVELNKRASLWLRLGFKHLPQDVESCTLHGPPSPSLLSCTWFTAPHGGQDPERCDDSEGHISFIPSRVSAKVPNGWTSLSTKKLLGELKKISPISSIVFVSRM